MTRQVHLEIGEFRVSNDGYVGDHGQWFANWLDDCSWLYFWFGFALNLDPVGLLSTRSIGNRKGWRLRPGRSSKLRYLRQDIQDWNSGLENGFFEITRWDTWKECVARQTGAFAPVFSPDGTCAMTRHSYTD